VELGVILDIIITKNKMLPKVPLQKGGFSVDLGNITKKEF